MGYAAYIEADGASREQLEAARQAYCDTLNDGLGGASQVKPCLRSWAKGKEGNTLTSQEDAESGAWIRADHQAQIAATKHLAGAKDISFLVKLDA